MKRPINKPKDDKAQLFRIRYYFAPGSELVWAATEGITLSIARRRHGKHCYVHPVKKPV
ncbi:hypothetical protein [Cupriavidus sp. TMH.W2]|uniref:hypothetical protein n=1 Tax=Cupriavidus sp. TMH.W2 TaxID=3434465 RepID=UPI003D7777FE